MANLMAAAATSDLSEVVVARAISGHFTQPAICVWLDWRTAKFLFLIGKGRKEEITLLKHWCFALLKARSVFYVLFCSSSATGNTTGVNYTESVLSPSFWRRYKTALIVSHAAISFFFSNHTVWENLKLNESEELALDFFSL